MKKFGLLSTSAIGSAAFFGLAFTAPAHAQVAPTQGSCTEDQRAAGQCDTEQEIESGQAAQSDQSLLVTGTRIRRPNLESNVPITSVSAEDLTSQGDVNVGDALNDLPSLRSTFSQANSNRFIGTAGINLLDLRGLGIERTLVLVNGRRHITASVGDFLVDTNTIPSDLIERVDVITGGNSAVYGSDAVAGVVNFVLRRDFEGVRIRGQGGVSQQGDRGIEFVSLTAGRNFLDDRANVAINLEYVNAEPLYFIDRPRLTGATDGRCQYNLNDFTVGEPPAGDGVPDNVFFCNVRNNAISNGGTISAANPLIPTAGPGSAAIAVACTDPRLGPGGTSAAIGAVRCINPGTPQGQLRTFRWDAAGLLQQDVPCFDFRPFGSGNIISCPTSQVPGATLRDTGQLAPGLDRYTANLLAHFDISDAFRPFVEAKYVHLFARQEGQPSFFQASFPAFFGGGRGLRCDNPFLTAQNIATLQNIGQCATPTSTLQVGRFNVDFGGRSELVTRDTYRIVAGIQGDFNDDWNYEVTFNYGHVDIHQDELNDLVIFDPFNNFADAGFLLATDPILLNGQIVCRDPAARAAGCVPINVFGAGRPSQAALDFVNTTSFVDSKASEYNAVGYVNGDLSQLFELPGGPISFVIGAEWRRETAFQEADPLSANFGTFFNAFATFDPPAFEVLEGFGEIQIPLLRDLPFAHELSLAAAARYSDYNTSANHTFAWNLNGTWAPVRDLRFRANYSKSVRVPTLGDLFSPASQNFNFISDPCDVLFIGLGPNRAANCAAQGIPAGFVNSLARSQTTEIASAGNPFLEEETSKSLTLGVVATPRWVPGLSVTVDYYRIELRNRIETLSAQTIINQCYDLPSINNQFCPLVTRNPDFTFASPAVISAGVNFARGEADGVDMEVAYRRTFDNGHRLNIRGIATYVIKRNNFVDPLNPDFNNRQLSEFGDPQWAANLNVTYGIGPFDLRYSVNYIGRMINQLCTYENFFEWDGRPPSNADCVADPWLPDVTYHAARLSMRVNDQFTFYMGADNLFDSPPPGGNLGTGAGDPYDAIGRYFYAGATVDF